MKTISLSRRILVATLFALVGVTAVGCDGGDEATGPSAPPAASTGSGNAGETPSGETPETPGDETDPTPAADGPWVVSNLPANGAKGVKSDAKIVVQFDRPMDTSSVLAAYSSADLPLAKVKIEWNAKDDALTLQPVDPLAYANGAADVAAKSYAFEISTAAKDKAGLPLQKAHASTFSTARRITSNVPMTSVMTGRALSNNTFSSVSLGAGDVMTKDGEREARAVFTFLFSAVLPDGADIEKATLLAAIASVDGTPDASLGAVTAEQVFFSLGLEGFAAEPVSGVATNITSPEKDGPSYRTADVTTMFKDDVANRIARNDRTQYRLRYLNGQNNDGAADLVTYDKGQTKLQIVYVAE